jgi:diadenosine tetraphosphate (Ap4A) HIT family hydrolase
MLCQVELADAHFGRVRLWEDRLWRLSAVPHGPIAGFAHLETRRHISFVTDLDGDEAGTLGSVLAAAARLLRDAAGAEKTYVSIFGDHVPHLHLNLAPHREGDALRGGPGLLVPDAVDLDPAVHGRLVESARRRVTEYF